jgi:hypothetical protein
LILSSHDISEISHVAGFIKFVLTKGPKRFREGEPTPLFLLTEEKGSKIPIAFEFLINENPINNHVSDLTVVISNCNIKSIGLEYTVKYSIQCRHFLTDKKISKPIPDIEIQLFEVLPNGHPEFMSSGQKGTLEEEISEYMCSLWSKLLD